VRSICGKDLLNNKRMEIKEIKERIIEEKNLRSSESADSLENL
jgi:hypothetical protein